MHRRDLWTRAALSLLGACSLAPAGAKTQVLVGIQSGRLIGEVGTLHVTTTLGAQPATDATLAPSALP